jgi:hypothetical protein
MEERCGALTKESTAQIRSQTNGQGRGAPAKKKMAYWFSVLEDVLGLREDGDHTGDHTIEV